MADEIRKAEIDIETKYDGSGSQQAAKDMDSLGTAVGKAAEGHTNLAEGLEKAEKKMEGVSGESREMYRIFSELDKVAPGLGESLRAAFTLPLGAVGALIWGVYEAKEAWDGFNKAIDETAKKAALAEFLDLIEKRLDILSDAAAAAQQFADAEANLEAGAQGVNIQLDAQLKTLEAIERAQAGLTSAQKELAIARIQQAEDTNQITPEQAAEARARVQQDAIAKEEAQKEAAQDAELHAKQQALDNARTQQAGLDAKAKATAKAVSSTKTHNEEAAIDPEKFVQQKNEAQKELDAAQENLQSVLTGIRLSNFGLSDSTGASDSEESIHKSQAEQRFARAQASVNSLQQRQSQFDQSKSDAAGVAFKAQQDAAAEADKTAKDNAKAIGDLSKEVVTLTQTIAATRPIDQQTAQTKSAAIGAQEGGRIAKQLATDQKVIEEYDNSKNASPDLIRKASLALSELQSAVKDLPDLLNKLAGFAELIPEMKAAQQRLGQAVNRATNDANSPN